MLISGKIPRFTQYVTCKSKIDSKKRVSTLLVLNRTISLPVPNVISQGHLPYITKIINTVLLTQILRDQSCSLTLLFLCGYGSFFIAGLVSVIAEPGMIASLNYAYRSTFG